MFRVTDADVAYNIGDYVPGRWHRTKVHSLLFVQQDSTMTHFAKHLTIAAICGTMFIVAALYLWFVIVEYEHAVHSSTRVLKHRGPPDCTQFYNNGNTQAWRTCMGVGAR